MGYRWCSIHSTGRYARLSFTAGTTRAPAHGRIYLHETRGASDHEPAKRRQRPLGSRSGRKRLRRDGGQPNDHPPDLFIFFTLASVASIDAASSRMAFANRSAASLGSCDRSARSA